MSPRLNGVLAVGLALLFGGCVCTPSLTRPVSQVPDLRGTWTGTWGGTPLTLVVVTQEEDPTSGVFVGPWLLFGQQLPGVSGVLSFTVGNEAISVNVRGRVGESNGRLTFVLDPLSVNGGHTPLTPPH